MKMTIEITEDLLAELMQLTGLRTKRDAVEYALRQTAMRAKRQRVWSQALAEFTPDQLAADAAPKAADLIDAPDIDEDAVRQAIASADRRKTLRSRGYSLNEGSAQQP